MTVNEYVSVPTLLLGFAGVALVVVLYYVGRGRRWSAAILFSWGIVMGVSMWAIADGENTRSLLFMVGLGAFIGAVFATNWLRQPPG
ncbi:MAG: hypothetical protein M3Q65_09290 [Chloroflexota bacterium]|nr:hypothetical protein [Chloroflexota bacterium]